VAEKVRSRRFSIRIIATEGGSMSPIEKDDEGRYVATSSPIYKRGNESAVGGHLSKGGRKVGSGAVLFVS